MSLIRALLAGLALLASTTVAGETLTVAVASNFRATADELAAAFTAETGEPVRISSGSTGKLYAQIVHGAPYDVFLAADLAHPALLVESGIGVAGSQQTYALGRLSLVSFDPALQEQDCLAALKGEQFRNIAIANPETAPFGAAAKAWLRQIGSWDAARSKLVLGESVAQAFQFVATGNASLGIVAESHLRNARLNDHLVCRTSIADGVSIRQGAIVLTRSEVPDVAEQFMVFLQSPAALTIVASHGYGVAAK